MKNFNLKNTVFLDDFINLFYIISRLGGSMSRVCELSGKSVMTGNNVSKANNRTRRRFLPNLQKSSMHSSVLGKTIQFRVAASTIRTVEKNGGIDSYLLKSSKTSLPAKAQKLRSEIIEAKEKSK